MKWTISFLSDQQIIVIKTNGVADESTSIEMAKSIAKIMAKHKATHCLIDHSSITSVSGSIVNIYYRPQELNKFQIPAKVKIAEVVFPAHREHFNFLETVCRNRGFDFSIFNDQETALQWLTK